MKYWHWTEKHMNVSWLFHVWKEITRLFSCCCGLFFTLGPRLRLNVYFSWSRCAEKTRFPLLEQNQLLLAVDTGKTQTNKAQKIQHAGVGRHSGCCGWVVLFSRMFSQHGGCICVESYDRGSVFIRPDKTMSMKGFTHWVTRPRFKSDVKNYSNG